MAHLRRPIQGVVNVARRAANTVHNVHDRVRPIYELARPALRHAGIDTAIPDKALSTYDGIRRATGR